MLESVRQPSGLVFKRDDGEPVNPSTLYHKFVTAAVTLGFPGVRFHDLRHSHATMLMAGGGAPRAVQERLGHQSVEITLDTYSHVSAGLQEQLVRLLEDSWSWIACLPQAVQ